MKKERYEIRDHAVGVASAGCEMRDQALGVASADGVPKVANRNWRPTLTREERYELIRAADMRAQQRIADGDY